MPQINPEIPIIGNPVATEDPKVKNALEAIVAALNALDNANIAANADINGAKLLNGSVATAKIADAAITADKIAPNAISVIGTAAPTSSILQFAGTSAPSGWLFCDGTAVSRSTYADLFNAVGTAYGEGNGSTTFNLPDLRGRVPVGRDTGQTEFDVRGESGGAKTHTLSTSEIPSHTHDGSGLSTNSTGAHTHTYTAATSSSSTNIAGGSNAAAITPVSNTTSSSGSHSHSISGNTGSTGGGSAHNNLQPYLVVNYIIKT